jgi:hypothetical protein
MERKIPLYHKKYVLGLQTFLRKKSTFWTGNGSCVEEIWKSYKDIIFEGNERFMPHKILTRYHDPEYCNREVKRYKVKVRRLSYSKREFGQHYQEEAKHLSKELMVAKRKAQETFLRSVLQNEGKCWAGFF